MSEWALAWPRLDYAADRGTIESMHLLLQLIGKLPLRLHPWINHGWHVALRPSPRGFVTRSLPAGERHFTVELDVLDGAMRVDLRQRLALVLPIAGLSHRRSARQAGCAADRAWPAGAAARRPNELPDPIRFAEDRRPREWTPTRRGGCTARSCAPIAGSTGSARSTAASPRRATCSGAASTSRCRASRAAARRSIPAAFPSLPDAVTREAYSHEVISAGFWPGGGGFDEAAFYAYAYPTPVALSVQPVAPEPAFWHRDLREFLLPYADVQAAADPDAELQRFLHSTFDAAATLLDWPPGLVIDERLISAARPHDPRIASARPSYIDAMDFAPDLGPVRRQRPRVAAVGLLMAALRRDAARRRRALLLRPRACGRPVAAGASTLG
jgi:hypothetical protein